MSQHYYRQYGQLLYSLCFVATLSFAVICMKIVQILLKSFAISILLFVRFIVEIDDFVPWLIAN